MGCPRVDMQRVCRGEENDVWEFRRHCVGFLASCKKPLRADLVVLIFLIAGMRPVEEKHRDMALRKKSVVNITLMQGALSVRNLLTGVLIDDIRSLNFSKLALATRNSNQ